MKSRKEKVILIVIAAVLFVSCIGLVVFYQSNNKISPDEGDATELSENEVKDSEKESDSEEISSAEIQGEPEEELSETVKEESSEGGVKDDAVRTPLTMENYPRFDGSTTMKNLAVGLASVMLGKERSEVQYMFDFNTTNYAYYYLMDGYRTILLAADPGEQVFNDLEEQGFEYEMLPIAREGLVFVVNEKNPVDSLSPDQIRKIYSGEITNWSQVGGDDVPIKAFQRSEGSGSQALMNKCVMEGTKIVEPEYIQVSQSMGDLIDEVALYDNTGNALGYTVYYYADSMKMADGLKILKIDGIEPNNDTISSGEYPFLDYYYCVISKDCAEESAERQIYNWLASEDGKKLVESEGYVPIKADK